MLALFLFLAAAPIQTIEVHGNKEVPPDVIVRLSGLQLGRAADKPEFESACTRIIRTGFFTSCNYAYAPNATHGYSVTFEVAEAERTQTVRLEIPGLDRQKFQAQEPLLTTKIPLVDVAVQTYVAALKRFLKTTEDPAIQVDLQHHETVIAFGEGKKVARREPEATAETARPKLVFGSLILKGLPQFTERRVRALWTVQPGAPLKDSAGDDFISEVFEAKIVPVEYLDAAARTEARPDSTTADVIITFKNGSSPR